MARKKVIPKLDLNNRLYRLSLETDFPNLIKKYLAYSDLKDIFIVPPIGWDNKSLTVFASEIFAVHEKSDMEQFAKNIVKVLEQKNLGIVGIDFTSMKIIYFKREDAPSFALGVEFAYTLRHDPAFELTVESHQKHIDYVIQKQIESDAKGKVKKPRKPRARKSRVN